MYLSKIEVKGLDELNERIVTARGWLKKMTFIEHEMLKMRIGGYDPYSDHATIDVEQNTMKVRAAPELNRILGVIEEFAEGLDLANRQEPQ